MTTAVVTTQDGTPVLPTLLGQGAVRIPIGGKIRPGIKVLTKKAAEEPKAKDIYRQGVTDGLSFEQIEQALIKALPQLKSPLIPRNIPWFTARAADFPNPEVARQILDTYGEDRGQGRHLYRFPVVFPSDHWQTVMPHELAAWSASEKRYWSQYSPDGQVRHCMRHAPIPIDHTGRRTIRIFGGRKTIQREDNGGICDPESCPEYQQRQCNLTGRFLFFIPGIRTISALELPTNSFYAMSHAIQRFQAIGHMRGGRISGFLGRTGETFYLTKVLREVPHIDASGRALRVPQWIIELEAPVDVTALLREGENQDTVIAQADFAARVLEGVKAEPVPQSPAPEELLAPPPMRPGHPTLEQVMNRIAGIGIDIDHFSRYADERWGCGWKINPQGRGRVWDEIERYRNDPEGYADKVDVALRGTV
ncbi:MAG: hypothetical protein LBR88_09925 [Zoogloeaceae bacterium]|nr:hypothetical protein [Zoogloeaceae bacterium]